jgi:EAL domain-containing protein (putative c-di-GMP-specific phosphodiesterase class I)/GGDEF domain-containing protein
MPPTTHSILGLVELTNTGAGDIGSKTTNRILHDAFGHRLNGWLKTSDQWSFLNDNRACVILRDIDSADELEIAVAKLDSVFKEPHYHLGQALPLIVTAGFTEFNDQNSDLALAMQQAGIALDQAKQSDHLFQLFSPQNATQLPEEGELLQQMHTALQQDDFQLFYQPMVHAGSHTLIGAEALVHWHHSARGTISPEQFIEVAERHEIIKPLTWWTLRSAASRLAQWPEQLSIAVNICPALLLDDDLSSEVKAALILFDVKPSRLHLEVTESIMVNHQALMLTQLAELHGIGVTISIDKFGAGVSSLAFLRDLPVDELKIDQRFVERIMVSSQDDAIVKTIIGLAHNLSLKAVAEGVESIAIADRLTQLRCDILQGSAFDKPLPVKEFELEYRI